MEETTEPKKALKTYSQDERRTILEEYRRRSVSQRQFCEERGVSVTSLCKWLRDLKRPQVKASRAGGFVELPAMESEDARSSSARGRSVQLEFAEGQVCAMRMDVGADVKWLGQLLQVIRCGG